MRVMTFRLKPNQDLFDEIEKVVRENNIEAGCVLSGVGSLIHSKIRFSNQTEYDEQDSTFEIVSITGTISTHGSHIHISISDPTGKTIGGHIGSGCKIYTTAEIVLAIFDDVSYKRELFENDSGYEELVVYKR